MGDLGISGVPVQRAGAQMIPGVAGWRAAKLKGAWIGLSWISLVDAGQAMQEMHKQTEGFCTVHNKNPILYGSGRG